MVTHTQFLRSLTLALLLGGCANQQSTSGLDAINRKFVTERVHHYTTYPLDTADDPLAAISTGSLRNDMIEDMLRLIDNHYENYITKVRREKAFSDFGLDLVSLGLGTAGTLSGAEATKTTLSALTTALTASRESFSKNVLLEQTIPILILKMDAQRATRKLAIRQAMRDKDTRGITPLKRYSAREALTDLTEYYHAGTITRALTSVAEDAAAQKKAADQANDKLRGITTNAADLP